MATEKDLSSNVTNKKTSSNLSKEESNWLNNLKSRDDMIITHAVKGGAVVIMDVDDYIKEANRQLKEEQ